MTRQNIRLSDKAAHDAALAEKKDNRLAMIFFGSIALAGGGFWGGMEYMERKADAVYGEIIQTGYAARVNQALAGKGLAADAEIPSLLATRSCPEERPFGAVVVAHPFGNAAQKESKLVCAALTDSKVDVLDASCETGACIKAIGLK